MQTFQRKPRLHKFVSGIIACILVLTNVLAINPSGAASVVYARDNGTTPVTPTNANDASGTSCNAVTSLNAYQVDLLDFVTENIQQANSQLTIEALQNRLAQSLNLPSNNCADAEIQRPQIAFANEVLVQYLAQKQDKIWSEYTPGHWDNIDQIYSSFPALLELLEQSYQEYLREFGVDRTAIETILTQKPISQTIFAQTLGLDASDLPLLDLEKVNYSQLFSDTHNIIDVFTQPESNDLYRLLVKAKANLIYQTLADNLREQVYQEHRATLLHERDSLSNLPGVQWQSYTATHVSLLWPYGVSVGNVNNDKVADLIFVSRQNTGTQVISLISDGKGNWNPVEHTFTETVSYQTSQIMDVDGNGLSDLVFVESDSGTGSLTLDIKLAQGDGQWRSKSTVYSEFKEFPSMNYNNYSYFFVGNINEDQLPDLIFLPSLGSQDRYDMITLLSTGDGGWEFQSQSFPNLAQLVGFPAPIPEDFNEDGLSDFMFSLPLLGDINHDGLTDLIFSEYIPESNQSKITTLTAPDENGWHVNQQFIEQKGMQSITGQGISGDVNHDGSTDTIIASQIPGERRLKIQTRFAQSDHTWKIVRNDYDAPPNSLGFQPIVGDFNGDQKADLIFARKPSENDRLKLFMTVSKGDGAWSPLAQDFSENAIAMMPWVPALVGNFDGDEQQRDDLLFYVTPGVTQPGQQVTVDLYLKSSHDLNLARLLTDDNIAERAQVEADWAVEDARAEKQADAQREAEIAALAVRTRIEAAFLPAAREALIQSAKNDQLRDAQTLGDYLFVDLASDISIQTNRSAFVIESLQTLVQSLLLGRESATDFKAPNFDNDRWRWTSSYGIWKAAMMVFFYSEDFLLPELRRNQWTPTFAEMTEKFNEVPNRRVAQEGLDFFWKEMVKFREPFSSSSFSSIQISDKLYFFLTPTGDSLYFSTLDSQANWSGWQRIDLEKESSIGSTGIKQIINFDDRIYLFYETIHDSVNVLVVGLNGKIIQELTNILPDLGNQHWQAVKTYQGTLFIVGNRAVYLWPPGNETGKPNNLDTYLTQPSNTRLEYVMEMESGGTLHFVNYSSGKFVIYSYSESTVTKKLLNSQSFPIGAMLEEPGASMHEIVVEGVPKFIGLVPIPYKVEYSGESGSDIQTENKWIFAYQDQGSADSRWTLVMLNKQMQEETRITSADAEIPVELRNIVMRSINVLWQSARDQIANSEVRLNIGDLVVEFPWRDDSWRDTNNWKIYKKIMLEGHNSDSSTPDTEAYPPINLDGLAQSSNSGLLTGNQPIGSPSVDMLDTYIEEMYLHAPLYLADKLNQAENYEDAAELYRIIYNPFIQPPTCRFTYSQPCVSSNTGWTDLPFGFRDTAEYRKNPFNPHRIAHLQPSIYAKYIVQKSVENLIDWADAEFSRDTYESIAKARELYETASTILKKEDSSSELCLAAPALCVPTSIAKDILHLRIGVNLEKIRTGRNIAGIHRVISKQASDIDPRLLIQNDLDGNEMQNDLIPNEPQINYRYSVLLERARQLTAQAQHLESYLLTTQEKLDEKTYTLLQAKNDLKLKQQQVALESLRVQEADQQILLTTMQSERAEFTQKHYEDLLTRGENGYELIAIELMKASQVLPSSIGGGIGGPSISFSPQSVAQTEANINATLASYERRKEEWAYQGKLAAFDIALAKANTKASEISKEVMTQQRDIAALSTELASNTIELLSDKQFTNAELYNWMISELQKLYRQELNLATAVARSAQLALSFELQEPLNLIAPQYWDNKRDGLVASEKLLFDLERLEQYRLESAKRRQEITKVISLARMMPSEFQQFRQTGVLNFSTLMDWFDRDFPGGYMRMIKSVEITVIALTPPGDSIHATLTNQGLSRIMVGSPWVEPKVIQRPPEMIALSSPIQASGLFELKLDDPMLLPFEGSGVETTWTFEMSPAANPLDFNSISDIWMTIRYTAKSDPDYRTMVINRMESTFQGRVFYGMRESFADAWYQFHNPRFFADNSAYTTPGQSLPYSLAFTLDRTFFPPNEEQIKLTKVTLASQQGEPFTFTVPISVTFTPEMALAPIRTGGKLEDAQWSSNAIFADKSPFGDWAIIVDVATCDSNQKAQFEEFCDHTEVNPQTGQRVMKDTGWLENLLLILDYSAKLRYARP